MAAIAIAAILTVGAANPHPDWTTYVTVTESGSHVLGNPDAPVKLTEYISYTCPHCAHFEKESHAPLVRNYIQSGKVSLEVRHLMRDPVDTAVALLTNCGAPGGFFGSHAFFLDSQERWIDTMRTENETQVQRWYNGDLGKRMRTIAADFGFYAMMKQRGYDQAAVNRCLSDETTARKLSEQTRKAKNAGINSTPSLLLNGLLLAGTYDWPSLDLQLKARM